MSKAIGLLEINSIAKGIEAADNLLKTADVKMIRTSSVCPGKFIALFSGDVSSVKSAIESGKSIAKDALYDSFLLANVHESVFPALYGTTQIEKYGALGIIETFTVASAIVAADTVVKTADCSLIEVRVASGMGGKSLVMFTGDVGAVQFALDAASKGVIYDGALVNKVVIPAPSPELMESLF